MLGTSSIMANEVFVANLQPLKPGEEDLAFSCALPMNANANLKVGVIQPLDVILHRQGSETAADGVILVGLRGAKQRHHAVALRLVDDAIIDAENIFRRLREAGAGLEAKDVANTRTWAQFKKLLRKSG